MSIDLTAMDSNWLQIMTGLVIYVAAKILDAILWFWTPHLKKPLCSHSTSDTWDNKEITRLVASVPCLPESEAVVQISDDTVVKLCDSFALARSESLAINLVHAKTRIPVPHVRRIIRRPPRRRKVFDLIVMDLIPNAKPLYTCWPSLSILAKLKVILTMRYYWRQLRCIQAPSTAPPGPLYPQPAKCYGFQFGYDGCGPFLTTAALAQYFQQQLVEAEYRSASGLAPAPGCQSLDESIFAPLVFTHNDLSMFNILLDDDGQLWIVDWNCAGFYPTWFEYLGIRFASQYVEPRSWKIATNFIVEPSLEMARWMSKIGRGCL